MAEGAGRGGTSAGRGGVRGTHGGHPGTLGPVAQPLAAERHPTWCRAALILAGQGGSLRMRYVGFPAIQRRSLQAIDHVQGLVFQSGSLRGQTQDTLLRLHMPCPLHPRVRAPTAVVRQEGLGHTSPQDKSWRSMSGGPGEPSGVTWRARGRPPGPDDGPDAQECANAISGGGEGVNPFPTLVVYTP